MKYSEYKVGIKEMLLEDGEVVGTEKYLERMMRVALLEALTFFPTLRPDELLTRNVESAVQDGHACYVGIPAGAKIREIRVVPSGMISAEDAEDLDTSDRLGPLQEIPWSERYRLINGYVTSCDLFYAVSPDRSELVVHPIIDTEKQLQIRIEGLGKSFKDDDVITVPEVMEDRFIIACTDFIRGRMAKDIERNATLAAANRESFMRELRSIYKEIPR